MQFRNPKDYELLQAMLNEGVFSLADYQGWEEPEEGDLLASALHNAPKINSRRWIAALIKTLQIHRYNSPIVHHNLFSELALDIDSIRSIIGLFCYPLNVIDDCLWVGVLRMDVNKEELNKVFEGFDSLFLCAISPEEAVVIEKEFRLYVKQSLKTMDLELELQTQREMD